jgi:adenylate kinase
MNAGRLVPDDLVLAILNERLRHADAREGFLLDGFPRNLAQARMIEKNVHVDTVLSFELPERLLIERLSGRRTCPVCQTAYNIVTQSPKVPGRCDRDGAELVQRPDDRPEAISTRLTVYADKTAPLLSYYRTAGLLRTVDATGTPEEVAARVRSALR